MLCCTRLEKWRRSGRQASQRVLHRASCIMHHAPCGQMELWRSRSSFILLTRSSTTYTSSRGSLSVVVGIEFVTRNLSNTQRSPPFVDYPAHKKRIRRYLHLSRTRDVHMDEHTRVYVAGRERNKHSGRQQPGSCRSRGDNNRDRVKRNETRRSQTTANTTKTGENVGAPYILEAPLDAGCYGTAVGYHTFAKRFQASLGKTPCATNACTELAPPSFSASPHSYRVPPV